MLADLGYSFNIDDLDIFDVQVYSIISNELNKLEIESSRTSR